jgi:hypothetical protein
MRNYHCSGQFLKNFAYVNEALIGVYTVEQIVPSPAVVIFNYSIFFIEMASLNNLMLVCV